MDVRAYHAIQRAYTRIHGGGEGTKQPDGDPDDAGTQARIFSKFTALAARKVTTDGTAPAGS